MDTPTRPALLALEPVLDVLVALARDHLVTTAQATTAGIGPAELRALVRARLIRRVIRGWYAVPSARDVAPPWVGRERFKAERAWHRILTAALVRSFDGRVAASHQSALVHHGVSLWRSDLSTAHLMRVGDEHSRHRRHGVIHPFCGVAPIETDGMLTVPVAVAVVQVGLVAGRGGARFPFESLVAADSALFHGSTTTDELAVAIELHHGVPGISPVRSLLQHANGSHESAGETRLMHNLRVLGYEMEPQAAVRVGSAAYRVDGKLKGEQVFVEFDGLAKYVDDEATGLAADEVEVRRRLAAEKRRQREIEDLTEGVFVRFGWSDLDVLATIDARMQAAIRRSRRRPA
jgi:hypothetical protein